MRKQLSSIEQGYKFTQIVDQLPKESFGLTAKGKLGFEKLTGAIGDALVNYLVLVTLEQQAQTQMLK